MDEIDALIRTYEEMKEGEESALKFFKYCAAFDIVSALKQMYHPFLWTLIESDDPDIVILACSALATGLSGEGTQQELTRTHQHLNRVDPCSTHCPESEREIYKLQMLDGMMMAQIIRARIQKN